MIVSNQNALHYLRYLAEGAQRFPDAVECQEAIHKVIITTERIATLIDVGLQLERIIGMEPDAGGLSG